MSKARTHARAIVYGSTKTYSASIGLSAAFRQHLAVSHCNQLHGYSIEVVATFEANELDHRNWVMDFGGLKSFKSWLESMFDHTVLIAEDDPFLDAFRKLAEQRVIALRVIDASGCEAMALMIFEFLERHILSLEGTRVRVVRVEVKEHGANSAYVRLRHPSEN